MVIITSIYESVIQFIHDIESLKIEKDFFKFDGFSDESIRSRIVYLCFVLKIQRTATQYNEALIDFLPAHKFFDLFDNFKAIYTRQITIDNHTYIAFSGAFAVVIFTIYDFLKYFLAILGRIACKFETFQHLLQADYIEQIFICYEYFGARTEVHLISHLLKLIL